MFVTGNNIYYQASPEHVAQQVTTTGEDKTIFNGVADWLYEGNIRPALPDIIERNILFVT